MKYPEKIGIVTVLYKSEAVLEDFFETLNQQTYDNFVLYVIDNKSPDGSLEKSKSLAKMVSFETFFIENEDNYGVAKGNNQGIEKAISDGCEYIILSNNDVLLNQNTIQNLYTGLQKTHADMAVPKIYYYGTDMIWAAGGKFYKFLGITKHIGGRQIDKGQYDRYYAVNYAPTCFMIIKRDIFSVVGLMDERYFVYSDDTDFVYRTMKKKFKLFYIFDSMVLHKESTSVGIKSDFYYYYLFRNRIFFSKKHCPNYKFIYNMNMIYHYGIRRFKLKNNSHVWQLIKKALQDGMNLQNKKED